MLYQLLKLCSLVLEIIQSAEIWKKGSRDCVEGSVRQTARETRKLRKMYDVWFPAEIMSARKHLLMVNMFMLSVSTGRMISERWIMKETEGSANGHIIVLPERLLAKRREPRQRADRGQCSSVGTVTRLLAGQLRNRHSIPSAGCFCSPKCPDSLWGPPRLLLSG